MRRIVTDVDGVLSQMNKVFHSNLLTLLNKWFGSKNSKELWYCGKNKKEFEERILSIKPPSYIHRAPRSIDTLPHWKASEYHNYTIYSPVCQK